MSEPIGKPRAGGDLRQQIDLEDLERRMRESLEPLHQHLAQSAPPPLQAPLPPNDPLAELARLVNNGPDRFQSVFAESGGGLTMPPPGRGLGVTRPPEFAVPVMPAAPAADADYQRNYASDFNRGDYAEPVAAQPMSQPPSLHVAAGEPAYAPAQSYSYGNYEQAPQPQDAPWIASDQPHVYEDYPEEEPRRTGRAKLLLGAAAVVLVAGGAGAYFLRASDTSPREAPAIMAQAGPAKVQPAQPRVDGPKQTISVLERGAGGGAESKVVQSGEQPLDLANASRGQGASRAPRTGEAGAPVTLAPPPPPPVANSIFAEPRRVKAVAVRPDGTIIEATPPAPAAPAPAAAPIGRPMDIASIVNSTAPARPAAGAPVTGAPAAAAPARQPEARSAPTPPPVPTARPVSTAQASAPQPSAPTTVASAPAAVAAASSASGTFAVQLAGTTSEDEARDALGRLTRRFASELGSYRPAVVRAESGSRTVYRVRVSNLSNEDANTLCARLKAGGGTCFVARN